MPPDFLKVANLSFEQIDFEADDYQLEDVDFRIFAGEKYNFYYFKEGFNKAFKIIGDKKSVAEFFAGNSNQQIPALIIQKDRSDFVIWDMFLAYLKKENPLNLFALATLAQKAARLNFDDYQKTLEANKDVFYEQNFIELIEWLGKESAELEKFINKNKADIRCLGFIKKEFGAHIVELSSCLGGLNKSGNKLFTLIEILSDIKRKDKKALTELYKELKIINDSEQDSNLAYKKIKSRLIEFRYPRLSRYIDNMDSHVSRFKKIAASVELIYDKDGESNELSCKFNFSNPEIFASRVNSLNAVSNSGIIDSMFEENSV